MIIEIIPFDTLFFKDGKPFSMGEESWANGIFPPSPSVIYGALRTAYFSEHLDKIEITGESDKDPTSKLKITTYELVLKGMRIFPMPLDLVLPLNRSDSIRFIEKLRGEYKVRPLKLIENNYVSSSKLFPFLLGSEDLVERLENLYISDSSLNEYLLGLEDEFTAYSLHPFKFEEPKIGIGRDDVTKSSQEARLYRVGLNRLKDVRIRVGFEGIDLPSEGFLKLGGEGKVVYYQEKKVNEIEIPVIEKRFKLYFATPAIFKNGWLPAWINPDNLEGVFPGTNLRVKLITAAIGKPLSIGGFDMKMMKPKPMRKAVPPGSTYYFDLIDQDLNKSALLNKVHYISDFDTTKEGFGIAYLGGVL